MQKLTVHQLGEWQRAETFSEATLYMELAPLKVSLRYIFYFRRQNFLKVEQRYTVASSRERVKYSSITRQGVDLDKKISRSSSAFRDVMEQIMKPSHTTVPLRSDQK